MLYNLITLDNVLLNLSYASACRKAVIYIAALQLAGYEGIGCYTDTRLPSMYKEWYVWQGNRRVIVCSIEKEG